MSRLQAPCPSCAAPVEFKCRTSLVSICSYCSSVVARGDKKLEDHGKVSDLAETQSPLKLGLKGKYRGRPFRIVGRVQYQHAAGGLWDEWYALFSNGKWGWLAEAQGKFYMTFRKKPKNESRVPPAADLHAGSTMKIGETTYTIAEVGEASAAGAEGEIPYDFVPGEPHPFADLYGPDGEFVTLEYGCEGPVAFFGSQVSLAEIGMAGLKSAEREARQIESKGVNCPNCAGALTLQAPDETQRVTCPYCNSLLDCNNGNLVFLSTLTTKVTPLIELGTKGTLFDVEYIVIGFMQRSVTYDRKYYWTEYLLYNREAGYRWLVHSDDHWSFSEPLSPADVVDYKSSAIWDGKEFKLFQRAIARVEYVLGEFYWKVSVDEEVTSRDMVYPPYMISVERSMMPTLTLAEEGARGRMNLGEVNMSLGTYLPVDRSVYGYWGVFIVALGLIFAGASLIKTTADGWLLWYALLAVSIVPIGSLIVNYMFDVNRWSDSEFSPYATGDD